MKNMSTIIKVLKFKNCFTYLEKHLKTVPVPENVNHIVIGIFMAMKIEYRIVVVVVTRCH